MSDYSDRRISDLERELVRLKDRDHRIVTALEKRVARLEAYVAELRKTAHTQLPQEIEP